MSKLIVGNWKMNGSKDSVLELVNSLLDCEFDNKVVVAPSFVYLDLVSSIFASKNSNISLAAQDLSIHNNGAYTGQVSSSMLADLSCKYVLVGHSERRSLCLEDNNIVAKKTLVAIKEGLIPIVCLGEDKKIYEEGKTETFIKKQLLTVLDKLKDHSDFVIAYEPVWAIGTGLVASAEYVGQVHEFLRKTVSDHSINLAKSPQILYGGSVKPENAASLLSMAEVDGLLVGGASLQAESFKKICGTV